VSPNEMVHEYELVDYVRRKKTQSELVEVPLDKGYLVAKRLLQKQSAPHGADGLGGFPAISADFGGFSVHRGRFFHQSGNTAAMHLKKTSILGSGARFRSDEENTRPKSQRPILNGKKLCQDSSEPAKARPTLSQMILIGVICWSRFALSFANPTESIRWLEMLTSFGL